MENTPLPTNQTKNTLELKESLVFNFLNKPFDESVGETSVLHLTNNHYEPLVCCVYK